VNCCAADLFCGAGGLSRGLKDAGIDVKAGWDLDPDCRWAYELGVGAQFRTADVADLSVEEVSKALAGAEVRLLAGCAPCQTFSTYLRGPKAVQASDGRWTLLDHFGRIVEGVLPEFVSMENVPAAAMYPAYKRFVGTLERLGYCVRHEVIDCQELGLPQARRRRVLLASRIGTAPQVTVGLARRNVRDSIGQMPAIEAGASWPADPYHRASALSNLNLRRLRLTPEGGDWRNWPEELRLACHTRTSGKTYRGVYGRMWWDKPAPTLTTLCGGVGNGRFGHPEQDRAITLREAALLQGFPENYEFKAPNEKLRPRTVARLIGNAVPPPLGKAIGEAILQAID
jgi:DNA (cytosine-5)-methyltransferase 1